MGLGKTRNLFFLKIMVLFAGIIAFVGICLRAIQLILLYDKSTGLIKLGTTAIALEMGVISCVVITIVIMIMVAIQIAPLTKYYELGTPTLAGYVLFVTTLLFLLQGMFGAADHYFFMQDYLFEIKNMDYDNMEKMRLLMPHYLALATDVFCILSAFSFYVLAMEYVREDEKKHLALYLVPVVWSTLVMISAIISVGSVVSIQSSWEKVVVTGFVMLFLYYTSYWACGYERRPKTTLAVFMRIVFPITSVIMVVPYLIAKLFRVKDVFVDIPYLAYLGLALYGVVVMIQFLGGASFILEKKGKQ